jgi:hypothetical protein
MRTYTVAENRTQTFVAVNKNLAMAALIKRTLVVAWRNKVVQSVITKDKSTWQNNKISNGNIFFKKCFSVLPPAIQIREQKPLMFEVNKIF